MSTVINRLPTPTWNWLGVNGAEVPAEKFSEVTADTLCISAEKNENKAPVFLNLENKDGNEILKKVIIEAKDGGDVTVFERCIASKTSSLEIKANLKAGAKLRLVQLLSPGVNASLYHKAEVTCSEDSSFQLISVLLGKGDVYLDNRVELNGYKSEFNADVGYLGEPSQTIDINLVVNHYGKNTSSLIAANGALTDSAKKIFRGTIDFKKGSSDSVGTENETVLMLSDDAVNKTVPLILCAEENVEGNHGATIGDLDDDTLFYFESRGIDRNHAQTMMARAAIERLARLSGNEDFEKQIIDKLDAEMNDRQDGGKS